MKLKSFYLLLSINGQKYKIFTIQPITILSILTIFNYKKQLYLLEYNGKIKNDLIINSMHVKDKAKIEIITIVGGG